MKVVLSLIRGYVDKNGESVFVSPGVIKIVEIESEDSFLYEEERVIVRDLDGVEYEIFDYKAL